VASSRPGSPIAPAWGRLRAILLVVAVAFGVAHAVALPESLGDDDSVNFAMGVESFDVAAHRPHPPGYPVYIALAKGSTGVVGAVAPSWDRDRRAAVGLAVWSLIGGVLAVFVVAEYWVAVGLSPLVATLAAILCVATPLFWFTAGRPLSDTFGLVAAVGVQVGFIRGLRARAAGSRTLPRAWLWAALGAGLVGGLRSQAIVLTAPFVLWCLVDLIARGPRRQAVQLVLAGAAGVLVWAVPLVWLSGGPAQYWSAVLSQGSEDVTGVPMLVLSPSWSRFTAALDETFRQPWSADTLAHVVLVAAIAGAMRLAWRDRKALAFVLLGLLPYVVFHLGVQETVTLRYALPIIVPVTGLAVVGLHALGSRAAVAAVAIAAAFGVAITQPPLQARAHGGAEVFAGFRAMHRVLPDEPATPKLHLHHQVWWGVRRAIEWYLPAWPGAVPPHPGDREWLKVVEHWRTGRSEPVWFLSALNRTDLVLFDPRTTRLAGRYERPPAVHDLVGGARILGFEWWRLDRPGWMLGRGWALTPENAGMTAADGVWPQQRPAEGFLLRRSEPTRLVIGGRYFALPDPAQTSIVVELDDRRIAEWPAASEFPWFVHWIDLPDGVPPGATPYARLVVRVAAAGANRMPELGLEQFDAARAGEPMFAFASDWHEREGDPQSGRLWRWSSGRSTIEVRGAVRGATLVLGGDSPLRDFDRAPTVVVRAGDRELARFSPSEDFVQRIAIPADALVQGAGEITVETDQTYSASERGQSADQRRLGLKITRVELR
jgi:hypothetical protein